MTSEQTIIPQDIKINPKENCIIIIIIITMLLLRYILKMPCIILVMRKSVTMQEECMRRACGEHYVYN
jgi:hypothetical protein